MVGTGYVGLVTGTCFSNMGNRVTCLDIDEAKIAKLNNGECPIFEPGLTDMMVRNAESGRLVFTTEAQQAYESAEVIFICVGTPSDDHGRADLSYVLGVAADIGRAIEAAPGDTGGSNDERRGKIIVVKSTVPVGTNQRVEAEIARHTNKPFFMASNPEFLKEGAAINDFMKPDRVVIGASSEGAGKRLTELYEPFVRQGNPIYVMDIPSAEMVKYAANTMLATKISFINEVAALCETYGADIDSVRRGMCSDSRIGNKFFYPGLGYGGSCFPKDVLASISMGEAKQTAVTLLQAVDRVNRRQRDRFIAKIDKHFDNNLAGKRIALWGLAFKPGTDDMRMAPSLTIIEHLLGYGATVTAFDPAAHETTQQAIGDKIEYAANEFDALEGADALIICTEWDQFRNANLDDVKARLKSPVVFDGRNLFKPSAMADSGFTYYSIGRPMIESAQTATAE